MQLTNDASARTGHFDERLVRLHFRECLVLFDRVAWGDLPRDEFGFVHAFSKVGQNEDIWIRGCVIGHIFFVPASVWFM